MQLKTIVTSEMVNNRIQTGKLVKKSKVTNVTTPMGRGYPEALQALVVLAANVSGACLLSIFICLTFPLSCLAAGSWRVVKATNPESILQDECAAANSSRVWQLQRVVRQSSCC